MKFNLLLTNRRRVRWLLRGLLAGAFGMLGLLLLHVKPSFWEIMALPGALLGLLLFWDKLFRQPGWALVAADGVAWANPADSPPISWKFMGIRSYRFAPSRNGVGLVLYLKNGKKTSIDGSFSDEFAAFWKAFEQAIRQYNQAHAEATIVVEKHFFERPISTKMLLGLLAASAVWAAWCISQQAAGIAYSPVLLVVLPYLSVWFASAGQRE